MTRLFLRWSAWLLCLTLLAACATFPGRLEEPTIDLVGLDVREIGLLQQRYVLTLAVQNPNARAIPVQGMSYRLEIGGQAFARGVSSRAFTLPAYGQTTVDVELTTNLLSTLRHMQTLLERNPDKLDYRLSGKLDVDLPLIGTLPFENKGEFRLNP